jgi:mono/diheme cytochrome c family protein
LEFISSRHFPDEVQGDFLLCNNIKFLGAKQHKMTANEDGFFEVSFRQNLFAAPKNYQYFRPVDLEFAPDGSLYFIDWSNVLIGHMQHNARDPKRDHVHGRIYRVTYPDRPLVPVAKVDGASISQLLENLKLPEYRTRYRTRRELRGRDHEAVYAATVKWAKGLSKSDKNYDHNMLEALWVLWGINKIDVPVLEAVLNAKDYRARAAAVQAVRFNKDVLPKATEYLVKAAQDPKALVRHEAVIQASWMGKDDGLKVIAEAKKKPVTSWTKLALESAEANLKGEKLEIHEEVPLPPHIAKSKRPIIRAYEAGYHLYRHGESCMQCHQANGEGLAGAFPPLAGSEWVNGDPELLAKIILHGVQGPLEVKGKKYTGYMQGFIHALETPENVAAVMTYVRNTWGNKDPSLIQGKHVEAWINKTKNQTQPYTEQQLRKEHKVKK